MRGVCSPGFLSCQGALLALSIIFVSCRIINFIATIYDSIVMHSGARRVFSGISKLSGSTFGIVHHICVLPNNLFYFVRVL